MITVNPAKKGKANKQQNKSIARFQPGKCLATSATDVPTKG